MVEPGCASFFLFEALHVADSNTSVAMLHTREEADDILGARKIGVVLLLGIM